VHIPNSVKTVFPIPPNEFLSEVGDSLSCSGHISIISHKDSPFREDAQRRDRYVNNTVIHPSTYRFRDISTID